MRLRAYAEGDFEALFALDQQCFAHEIAYSRGELRYFLKHPRCFSVIAEDGIGRDAGLLAGFFIAESSMSKGKRVGHIITIDVAPAARRGGTGRALMAGCEERFAALGCVSAHLEVAVDNLAALAFYARLGFEQAGRIPGYYAAKIDAFTMSKPLE
ncbi:MAG: GNAT family N-acetyltransferase [Acidobacteriaceae bacterium]